MSATKFHCVIDGLTRLCGIDASAGAGIFEADFRKLSTTPKRAHLCKDCLKKLGEEEIMEEPADSAPAPKPKATAHKKPKTKSRGK